MRCPYCEGKMRKGQLHAVGAGAGEEAGDEDKTWRYLSDKIVSGT